MAPKSFLLVSVAIACLFSLATAEPIPVIPDRVQLQPRGTTCTPQTGGSPSVDDVPAIQSAINACPSGTIVIPSGQTYHINSQLSFSGCSGCTLQLNGELSVSTDFTYWDGKGQIIHIQNINGATITGSGTINGNGQASWDHIITTPSYKRPYLIRVDGSTNIKMSGITIKAAPSFHVVTGGNSKNIHYSDLTLYSVSTSANVAHNTDGFDIGPASFVTVENTKVTNDDDCVVLKPGASYVTTTGVTCVGSHGLSVGSLAGSSGSNDIVTNSIFKNCTMSGGMKAAGIKYYPGGSTHGTGSVSNVTWEDIICDSCTYAIQISTCYSSTAADCSTNPSTGKISDVVFSGFSGTTSGHYKDVVADMDCSVAGTCGIQIQDFTVKAPSGANKVLCANTPANLGVTCTSGASG
ncbi:putative endo-xylogalacturonan hydrolase A [Fusarium keratoplasticum]|uniref:Endo-xylogalacturonan hydrolase A n=1 Tax=Fusarium keratoplasticum TaxID=1328300 RepID=A0ACC0QQT8_9HYPO|nr:putative endo-xylogalacturonan hydrolase A [Fusarium keratoplasticum]KAI8663169.1 putative endo-xylogalacturonan hydrolase A [Fusarium keratoplasticum]